MSSSSHLKRKLQKEILYDQWQRKMPQPQEMFYGETYFVDGTNGSANYDGLSIEHAKATIATAITASNADIVLNAQHNNRIYIMGGNYDENITTGATQCDLIGLDTNRSGWSPRLTGNIAISGVNGMRLFNLVVQSDAAGTSCVKLSGNCFNFEMHNCEIRAPGSSTGKGFETASGSNAYYTKIANCRFTAAHKYGIYLDGGVKATQILDNWINAQTAGIYFVIGMTVDFESLIKDNIICRSDAGTEDDLAVGIHFACNDRTPNVMVVHNYIGALACIQYDSSETNYWQSLNCIDNHCIDADDGGWDRISAA